MRDLALTGGGLASPLAVMPAPGGPQAPFRLVNSSGWVNTNSSTGSAPVNLGFTTTKGNYLLCFIAGNNASAAHGVFEFAPTGGTIVPGVMASGSAGGTSTVLDVVRMTGGNEADLLFGLAEIESPFSSGTLDNWDIANALFIEVSGLMGAPLAWSTGTGSGTTPSALLSPPLSFRKAVAFGAICARTDGGGSLAQPPGAQGWTQLIYEASAAGFLGAWIGYQLVPAASISGITLSSPGSTIPAGNDWVALVHVIA